MYRTLDERLNIAIASQFTCALMSNTKWRKVFHILSSPALGLSRFTFKSIEHVHPTADVYTEGIRNTRLPRDELEAYRWLEELPPPNMIGEGGIGDCLGGGPLYFRAIEWVEIPARYVIPGVPQYRRERQVIHQDIAAVARALSAAGQFPIELTDERLRLYGYRK